MSVNVFYVITLTALIVGLYKYLETERFVNTPDPTIKFMSTVDTYNFIQADPDFYIANLSPTDMYARKVKLASDYKQRAAGASTEFTTEQKLRLSKAVRNADRFFAKLRVKGIDCKKIGDIPWVIALTQGTVYEDGLPHTRGGVIFLSTEIDETPENLLRILVHEKVHLYTRMYPENAAYYLESNGYIKWKQRLGVPRIRSNPDLDAWIYIEPVSESPMVAYYSSDRPHSISDIVLSHPSGEHPFELLAYTIEAKLSNV